MSNELGSWREQSCNYERDDLSLTNNNLNILLYTRFESISDSTPWTDVNPLANWPVVHGRIRSPVYSYVSPVEIWKEEI